MTLPETIREEARKLRDEHGLDDRAAINSGLCMQLAARVDERVEEVERITGAHIFGSFDYGGHSWLYRNGRHYDAECPDGVRSFDRMPYWQRHLPDVEEYASDLLDTEYVDGAARTK